MTERRKSLEATVTWILEATPGGQTLEEAVEAIMELLDKEYARGKFEGKHLVAPGEPGYWE